MEESIEIGSNTKKRLDYIDSAKGIGILFVLIGHLCSLKFGLGQYLYSFHMPLFFIISGFLLFYNDSWRDMSGKDIFIKKMKSLFYPYVVFSILALIYIYFAKNAGFIDGIRAFISLDGIGALWFLPSLLIAELVFIYIMKYLDKFHLICLFIILVLTTLISMWGADLSYFTLTGVNKYLGLSIINRSLIACIFIAIGYYLSSFKSRINKNKLIMIAVVCFIINLCLFRYNLANLHYSAIGNPILYYVNALTGSFAYIGIAELCFAKVKLLIFYGKNSLILFVTHGPLGVIKLVEKICVNLPVSLRWISMVVLLIVIETVIVLVINKYLRFLVSYNELKRVLKYLF